ncbi:TetR/AcrR family transcriptional regulator [Photobacterium sanctipauli]|uniref:TetR/AcrR family transcriptional regulator n=1 Tax=Photobacterium sanctipauli TaxID=1342794 RepID=A0A2T3NUI1_9GAMM|nr:TetR/AcrR family transcriptional regulator [Photobacterium sanctipauli]PSW19888.1 TetR/AcrR family transcriptional regulator [Photobacterium sanctipauli]
MGKKQQIIQVAIELFATQGYEKTSISAICAHAHVSKGAVFHHFKNKEELLREVFIHMAEIVNEVDDNVDAMTEGLSAKEKLINLLDHIFMSMALPEKQLSYQFELQILCQSTMRAVLEDLIEDRYRLMMASFQTILRDIPSADGVVDSHMLIAEIDGIAINYVFAKDDYPLEEIKKRFINKYLLLLGFEKIK